MILYYQTDTIEPGSVFLLPARRSSAATRVENFVAFSGRERRRIVVVGQEKTSKHRQYSSITQLVSQHIRVLSELIVNATNVPQTLLECQGKEVGN